MPDVAVTWLGHGSFRLDSPGGKRIYLDPWFTGPTCPEAEKEPERCDVVLVTHGHFDHVDGVAALSERFDCPVLAIYELAQWLAQNGSPKAGEGAMGKGGTVSIGGISYTLVHAIHSSSAPDGTYTGEPCGFVIGFENGTVLYCSGDTGVHMEMQLIGRIYQPQAAILAIGDLYTMSPREAAVACELLGPQLETVVPAHWGTFPALTGTPTQLAGLVSGVTVHDIQPGDTVTV